MAEAGRMDSDSVRENRIGILEKTDYDNFKRPTEQNPTENE